MRTFRLTYLLLALIFCASCDHLNQNDFEIAENEPLEEIVAQSLGTLKVNDITYVFNRNEGQTVTKFEDGNRIYEFTYDESSLNLRKIDDYSQLRSSSSKVRFENVVTGEFVDLINFREISENEVIFDVTTSEGFHIKNLTLQSNISEFSSSDSRIQACWYCYVVVGKAMFKAVLDAIGDNFDSNCAKAIGSCGERGVKNITITEGWFSNSCSVTCN